MKKNRFALLAFAAVIFCGCEQLQSTLSSEMKETLAEETGVAVIDSNTWYYNGSEKTDVSSESASLKISFTRKVKVSEDGIKAAFEIQYFDTDGNSTLVTKSSSAGTMSADGMSYNLDMSNALSLIDAETTQGNTVTATVKVSGFVCAEGEQAGRALSAITKTISVAPLFEEKVLGSIEFASAENVFEIPLLGAVQIEGTPSVESEEFPEGVTADSFNISLSDAGTKIILEPKDNSLVGNDFSATLKVSVRPLICGTAYEKEFDLSFVSTSVSSTDTMEFVSGDSNGWAENCDITSMKVKNDSENLYVTIEFAEVPKTWKENPRASILIGKADTSAAEDTSSLVGIWTGAGISTTATLNNGTILKFFSQGHGIDTGAADGIISSVTWSGDNSSGYVPSSNILKYTIPLSTVGSAGDKINIVSFFSGNVWNSDDDTGLTVINAVPASCVTVDAYSTVVDMSKALEYTIQ